MDSKRVKAQEWAGDGGATCGRGAINGRVATNGQGATAGCPGNRSLFVAAGRPGKGRAAVAKGPGKGWLFAALALATMLMPIYARGEESARGEQAASGRESSRGEQSSRAEESMDQTPVRYLANQRAWVLTTAHTSYVMGVNEQGDLQSLCWGGRLESDGDVSPARLSPEHASFDSPETMSNLEYPGWGGRYYNEPALKVTLASGVSRPGAEVFELRDSRRPARNPPERYSI